MKWELADYSCHPIDGEASQVEACAAQLEAVAGDIRDQIDRLRSINAGEFWVSVSGAAEEFQSVVDDLPEKLDLVGVRYERVAEALNVFHPALASTKDDAEQNIELAAAAQDELDRAEAGIEEMEAFADQAQRSADEFNESLEPGEPRREPEAWCGEDFYETRASAQADLDRAVAAVHRAVESFERAAEACEEAIYEAGNDDLKNDSGIRAAFSRAMSALGEFALDLLDAYVQILSVIGAVLAIVVVVLIIVAASPFLIKALIIAGLVIAATVFVGTVILYFNDRRTGWDVAWAGIGLLVAGLGGAGSAVQLFFTGAGASLAAFDLGVTAGGAGGGEFLESTYDTFSAIDLPDLGDVYGPILVPGVPGASPLDVLRPGSDLHGLARDSLEILFEPVKDLSELDVPSTLFDAWKDMPTMPLPPVPPGPTDLSQIAFQVDINIDVNVDVQVGGTR